MLDSAAISPILSRARTAATISVLAVALVPVHGQPSSKDVALERGELPARWTAESAGCQGAEPFRTHEYTATFIISRQSGCTNFEKPFLYLLLGSTEALLVD